MPFSRYPVLRSAMSRHKATKTSHDMLWAHQKFDGALISQMYYTALLGPLQARLGHHVLHVGCGLGRATLGACYQVGRPGSVTALEVEPSVVKFARGNQGRERQKALGWVIPGRIQNDGMSTECSGCVLKGEACVPTFDRCMTYAKLPFPDDARFDCVAADRALHHDDRDAAREILHELALTRLSLFPHPSCCCSC